MTSRTTWTPFRFNFRKVFDIVSAASGAEALEVLRQRDVAVIITDQRMPKMTGLELLKEAKELRPDAVGIILTAFTDVDVLIEAITLGAGLPLHHQAVGRQGGPRHPCSTRSIATT
jgi:DNA-binding NtrC family response regulator